MILVVNVAIISLQARRGGKYSMFDGGSRVPMIVWAPKKIVPGESAALFSHVDFLASFSQLSEVTIPAEQYADSLDMSAVLLGYDKTGREHLVTEGIGSKTVLRKNNWVYIPPHEGPAIFADKGIETGNDLDPQLYDMAADIGQRHNIADANPETVIALDALLESIHGDTPPADMIQLMSALSDVRQETHTYFLIEHLVTFSCNQLVLIVDGNLS